MPATLPRSVKLPSALDPPCARPGSVAGCRAPPHASSGDARW